MDLKKETTSRRAQNELIFANVLLKAQMDASPSAIVVVDEERRILSFNDRFVKMWHFSEARVLEADGGLILESILLQVKHRQKVLDELQELSTEIDKPAETTIETLDGRFVDRYTVPLRDPSGQLLGRAWFFTDVTAQKSVLAEAVRASRFDALTGLLNRVALIETLEGAIAKSRLDGKPFAVLYLDVDHLKDVNKTLGYAAGDDLLKAVTIRLVSNSGRDDVIARVGGDAFAVLATDISGMDDVRILADKLSRVLSEPYSLSSASINNDSSIGIDYFSDHHFDADEILDHISIAHQCAREEGNEGYLFFTSAMGAEVKLRGTVASELRDAIASEDLFLLYQPQIDMLTGEIVGVEALVRWRHPIHGVLGPGTFIPIAEQMGTIGALGRWVLMAAARQSSAWLKAGQRPLRMAVNLSSLQFKETVGLEDDIAAALSETDLPPKLLELELTETVLMDLSEAHGDLLTRLRGVGITLAIDDFGTGYSSLDYLRRFPADRIKIAETFVRDLPTAPVNTAIIKATIGLAREMGISVIAEGIETQEQALILQQLGCDEGQGFFFARPLTAEVFTPMLVGDRRIDCGFLFPIGPTSPTHFSVG